MPSNHACIVGSATVLIALKEGITHLAFGVAVTLAFIVILDASSLCRHIGKQAAAINRLAISDLGQTRLRERIGHSVGLLVGAVVALIIDFLS